MGWTLWMRALPQPAPSGLPSLYRDWTTIPGSVLAELDPPGFTLAEASAQDARGEAQRPWGLSVRLRRDDTGVAKLAEVLSLDDSAPIAILYRAPAGPLRVDDFSGEVHSCASLSEAQDRILGSV